MNRFNELREQITEVVCIGIFFGVAFPFVIIIGLGLYLLWY